ncbi:uncharacterized protein [Argopecten irradians]|uniref:uncharacterized protein n=1 Tax=Argopecten irradians TaxID=31199 RepID=UPI00371ADD25
MTLLHRGRTLHADDRIMTLGSASELILVVEGKNNMSEDAPELPDNAVQAFMHNADAKQISENIVKFVLQKTANTEEPTEILREYSKAFITGRTLDMTDVTTPLDEGETTHLYIGRGTLFENGTEEVMTASNLRNTVEVTFYGELGEDLGGPRLEFFRLFIEEFVETQVCAEDGKITLRKSTDDIVHQRYYASGIIIGLSAIQGGPCAPFLHTLLPQLKDQEEHHRQFKAGLERVGIWQLLQQKPTVAHLFKPRNRQLTVTRLLQLLTPVFAEPGSNRRMAEDRAYSCFVRYVRNVAAGRRNISLGDILAFVTCLKEEPVMGFMKLPTVRFTELSGNLPTSSTCSREMCLPIDIQNEEEMFYKYDLAFANAYFGCV